MADRTTYQNDHLPRFLATYPTKLHHKTIGPFNDLVVFWSQNEGSQNHSSSDDPDPWVIHEKIKSLFSKVLFGFDRLLVQFWAPVTTGGRRLLTTCDQPFALHDLDPDLVKYRLSSLKSQYNIDVNRLEVGEDPRLITYAFLNHLPELVLDTEEVHMPYFVLPICDPSQNTCVGVVECATRKPEYLLAFCTRLKYLNATFEEVGLSTFHVQERLPYKTIRGLERAKDEIEEALMIIGKMLNLSLAQVWIAYKDENHVPFSPSLEDTQTKQMLALKLAGYCVGSDLGMSRFEDYYDACAMLALRKSLAAKTLQNYEPHFCLKISNLSTIEQLVSSPHDEYSCFVVCLRSIDTGDFDYAFEFIWPHHRNYIIFLELLLFTLKRCLPSFKFASGAELGDELRILDVEASPGSEIEFFRNFEGNRLSTIPEALEEGRRRVAEECITSTEMKCKTTPIPLPQEDIEQQFGRTMKEAAKNLNVSLSTLKRKCKDIGLSEWQGPNFVKRKVNGSYKNQSDINEEDNGVIQDPLTINNENTLTIKAKYANDLIKFRLPISLATFVAVEMEIGKKFKLNPATYKLKYLDEDEDLILMVSDQDMRDCIKSLRNFNRTAIQLLVLPST